jgi:TP901 family phage tail tape measure protein
LTDLNVALIMRFVDRATAPARAAAGAVGAMGDRVARAGRAAAVASDRMTAAGNGYLRSAQRQAIGLGAQAAALYALVRPAITAETKLAEIGKVVDFQAPDGLQMLGRDIQNLVTDGGLAMSAAGVADIVAAAGQADLVADNLPDDERRRQLIEFAEAAGQMGVAFDISAEQAGVAMATWRTNMGLTQAEAIDLGDAINHLSNNMAGAYGAGGIAEVVQRQGALAVSAGLAAEEVAALSSALLSTGAAPEVAATALKNLTLSLKAGENATPRMQRAFRALGLDALDLSQRMQVDATGAILNLFDALNALPASDRIGALRNIVGEESVGALAPLLENAGNLANAFELVGDKGRYAGSMGLEYERIAETTATHLRLLSNRVNAVATAFGSGLLPMLNDWIDTMGPALGKAVDWIEMNPELVKELGSAAGAFLLLSGAVVALNFSLGTFLGLAGKSLKVAKGLAALTPATIGGAAVVGGTAWYLKHQIDTAPIGGMVGGLLEEIEGTPGLADEDGNIIVNGRIINSDAALRRLYGLDPVDGQPELLYPPDHPDNADRDYGSYFAAAGARARRERRLASQVTVGDIHVHPTPGMDPAAIAQAVRDEMMRAANGWLHDGGEYADAP